MLVLRKTAIIFVKKNLYVKKGRKWQKTHFYFVLFHQTGQTAKNQKCDISQLSSMTMKFGISAGRRLFGIGKTDSNFKI